MIAFAQSENSTMDPMFCAIPAIFNVILVKVVVNFAPVVLEIEFLCLLLPLLPQLMESGATVYVHLKVSIEPVSEYTIVRPVLWL